MQGNLNIDSNKLYGFNRLIIRKTSEIIIDQDVHNDFIELITKRYNAKKSYSVESENLFRELTEMSGLSIHKTSTKFSKIIKSSNNQTQTIEYYNNLTE